MCGGRKEIDWLAGGDVNLFSFTWLHELVLDTCFLDSLIKSIPVVTKPGLVNVTGKGRACLVGFLTCCEPVPFLFTWIHGSVSDFFLIQRQEYSFGLVSFKV